MLNEADTRKIIDEQLRKVGWEADSDNLRYSKGTRPQKGRNIAVAEWQTDSVFVDYALFIGMKMIATIETKATHKDVSAVIDCQGKYYARNIRDEDKVYWLGEWHGFKVPFTFATNARPYNRQLETKSGIWFLDLRRTDKAPNLKLCTVGSGRRELSTSLNAIYRHATRNCKGFRLIFFATT